MKHNHDFIPRVGDIRPSQLLYTFGIGSIIDLPNISAIVLGIDAWSRNDMQPINEDRLLAAIRHYLGRQVQTLYLPPMPQNGSEVNNPFDSSSRIGVPVDAFPRWYRCPSCNLLSTIDSGLFELDTVPFHPERTRYKHTTCSKSPKPPTVIPARFLVTCKNGHLDDFPWMYYLHQGYTPCPGPLRLREVDVSGTVGGILIECEGCDKKRMLVHAFEEVNQNLVLPPCTGKHPHLRIRAAEQCTEKSVPILLGSSNSWFPFTISTLSLPPLNNIQLRELIEANWANLLSITSKEQITMFRSVPALQSVMRKFIDYSDEEMFSEIQEKRQGPKNKSGGEPTDIKTPEWRIFTGSDPKLRSEYLILKTAEVPDSFKDSISRVVLVERLREVGALIGFTRLDPPEEYLFDDNLSMPRVSISKSSPTWIPSSVSKGEGIFIQFNEQIIKEWIKRKEIEKYEDLFFHAYQSWRQKRKLEANASFPGMRFILLHSFSHALMRQLCIECGYTAASIRERVYSRDSSKSEESMAGILIYTAAADSEGTLGGLVSLGQKDNLDRLINQALEEIRICSSDPLCSEHAPDPDGSSLHGSACHSCLFAPETSCETGNRFLDRSVLIPTFITKDNCFFNLD